MLCVVFILSLMSCVDEEAVAVDEEAVTIEFDKQEILTTQSINFSDTSPNEPTNRTWVFEGGNPSTSSERTQNVYYQNSGVFKVTLELYYKSTDQTIIKTDYIDVLEPDFTNGLVAYYPFSGNANDESVYSNHGYVDGPFLDVDRFGNTDGCYSFDGDDDIIIVPDSEQLSLKGNLTISSWIYPKEIKSQVVFRKGGCNAREYPYQLRLSSTNYTTFQTWTAEDGLTNAGKIGYMIDNWYLITGVLKGRMMYLYINGVLESTNEITGDLIENVKSLYIGTRLQLPSSTFNGKIDEIRIYNRALSESEVLYLYEKNI